MSNNSFVKCVYCDQLVLIRFAHKHIRNIHPKLKNNCLVCKARQAEIIVLGEHILNQHPTSIIQKSNVRKCLNCNLNFIWEDYVKHAQYCSSKKNEFTCFKCERKLPLEQLILHHRNLTCPTPINKSNRTKQLDDEEYLDLKHNKRNYLEILTPVGGQPKSKKNQTNS